MNEWMAKVNEMKTLRGGSQRDATTPSTAGVRSRAPTAPAPITPLVSSASSPAVFASRGRAGTAATSKIVVPPSVMRSLTSKSGESLANEVALLRKQLDEVEKEAHTAKRELDDVKVKREEARKRLRMKQQQQIQSLKMNSMQRQLEHKQSALLAPTPANRQSVRKSNRVSTHASGGSVVSHITRVIQEMGRLEDTVKAAEEAQARAENELLEFAAERRKTDEALDSLKQQLEMMLELITSAIAEVAGDVQLHDLCSQIKVGLHGCQVILTTKTVSSLPSGGGAIAVEEKQARRRGMSFGTSPAISVAPPPPTPPGLAPPPPPPGDLSLLTAIREGKQDADLQALRQKRASMRKSVVVVQSLTQTLRDAMKMRNESMAGDDDDDDDESYDWLS